MILSDNETRFDLLNNSAIAKTIVSVINESEEPVSIGVHGDWGVGKSSVLVMVEDMLSTNAMENSEKSEEEELDFDALLEIEENACHAGSEGEPDSSAEEVLTVKFNSWQYQGFEDAKIALMSAIVKALEKRAKSYYKKHPVKNAVEKLKEICWRIWDNIDKLSIIKGVGKVALALTTNAGKVELIKSGIKHVQDIAMDNDKRDQLIDLAGNLFKSDSTQNTGYREMDEFRSNYSELFKTAHVKKLVVLIDDLDRCLPKVAIETLEAVRMFLSMENTAFIIAADDAMIRYSVQEYFPRMITQIDDKSGINNQFAEKYLEKLIQVPFHVPRIGEIEARIYILLLMIESVTGESDGLKALADKAIEKLGRPWLLEQFSTEEIREVMGDEYDVVIENVKIAKSIEELLAKNTAGNPRNIKRFVNMLILRSQVAYNKGFKDTELKKSVLAKMMLAEQYIGGFYKELAKELREDGTCAIFDKPKEENKGEKESEEQVSKQSEEVTDENENEKVAKKKNVKSGKAAIKEKNDKPVTNNISLKELLESDDVKAWIETKPSLEGEDLRPYFFACKEKEDFFFNTQEERLREIIMVVRGGKLNVANNKNKIEKLNSNDARYILKAVTQGIFIQELSGNKPPKSIEGIRAYVQIRTELQEALADFLLTLPLEKLGVWAVSGWNECIPKSSSAYSKLLKFINGIAEKNEDSFVKTAAAKVQKNL